MNIEIRNDSVHIEGYVNAVERDSRPVICGECGKCVEQMRAGVFDTALRAEKNVDILLNHKKDRKLGCTADGTLSLKEDSIGLRAVADITDPEVIDKARSGRLKGWSFGFKKLASEIEERANALPRRIVTALDLFEVSIIDDRFTPCYAGTSIEMRAEEAEEIETRTNDAEITVTELSEAVEGNDTTDAEDAAESVSERAEEAAPVHNEWCDAYLRYLELEERFNPYHDPENGRFISADGASSGAGYLYSKGGKSAYVFNSKDGADFDDDEYAKWQAQKASSPKELDKKMIERVNSQGSNFYDAGSAIERKYKKELSEIDTLNISNADKKEAKTKIYDYSNNELKARTGYYDLYTAGVAREVSGSKKSLNKAMGIYSEHESYMNSLRNKSSNNTHSEKKKAEETLFKNAAAEANKTGSREMTVNGETWFRTTRSSSTWQKGTLRDYNAKKAFDKSQKDVWMGARKSWSSLSTEEKAKWYK